MLFKVKGILRIASLGIQCLETGLKLANTLVESLQPSRFPNQIISIHHCLLEQGVTWSWCTGKHLGHFGLSAWNLLVHKVFKRLKCTICIPVHCGEGSCIHWLPWLGMASLKWSWTNKWKKVNLLCQGSLWPVNNVSTSGPHVCSCYGIAVKLVPVILRDECMCHGVCRQ